MKILQKALSFRTINCYNIKCYDGRSFPQGRLQGHLTLEHRTVLHGTATVGAKKTTFRSIFPERLGIQILWKRSL